MNFETFWASFPKRIAKGAALKAWLKLKPDAKLTASILQAIQSQKDYRKKVEAENLKSPKWKQIFIPDWKHPATWLNQQCWLDEIPEDEKKAVDNTKYCCGCRKESQYLYPSKNGLVCIKCYEYLRLQA